MDAASSALPARVRLTSNHSAPIVAQHSDGGEDFIGGRADAGNLGYSGD